MGTGQNMLRGLNGNSLSHGVPAFLHSWIDFPGVAFSIALYPGLSWVGHLLWSRSNKLSGGVYGSYRKVAALVGEEEDGAFILVTVWLGIGEGGTEEGLVEFSAQGPPRVGHMTTSPAQMYKVASVCWFEGGLDRGYCGTIPEDLRAKPSLPQAHPAL